MQPYPGAQPTLSISRFLCALTSPAIHPFALLMRKLLYTVATLLPPASWVSCSGKAKQPHNCPFTCSSGRFLASMGTPPPADQPCHAPPIL